MARVLLVRHGEAAVGGAVGVAVAFTPLVAVNAAVSAAAGSRRVVVRRPADATPRPVDLRLQADGAAR